MEDKYKLYSGHNALEIENRETLFVPESTDRGERMLDISSRLLRDRIIFLVDPIDSYVAKSICSQLLVLDSEDNTKPILLYINNCPGGEVSAASSMLDFMACIKSKVYTYASGMVASAASVILACGQKGHRYATPSAKIMIHQPHGGARGQVTDIVIQVEEMLKAKKHSIEILAERCGKTFAELEKLMERDYFMSAIEAKELGIIDNVLVGSFDKY